MKFICSSCDRVVELSQFRMDGELLVLVCPQCGAQNQGISPAQPAQAEEQRVANGSNNPALRGNPHPPSTLPSAGSNVVPLRRKDRETVIAATEAPEGYCPKCVAPRKTTARSCPSCGLIYENYRFEEHRPSTQLQQQWEKLSEQWNDSPAHNAFLRSAMSRGELAAAAKLYRIRSVRTPEDAMAKQAKDEVLRLAQMPMELPRVAGRAQLDREPKAVQKAMLWLGVLAMMLLMAWMVLGQLMSPRL